MPRPRIKVKALSLTVIFLPCFCAISIRVGLLIILVPITYDAKASPLLGAFLAGLVFCSNGGAHHMFVGQFKRVMQWLMRIFYASCIGFQVPFHLFTDPTVLLQGLAFSGALLGKFVAGFMSPNFHGKDRFKYTHLRDCLMVGLSMSTEGEFAFIICSFAVTHEMMTQELYASVCVAVLLSTVIGPYFLQKTITYYNNKIENDVFGAVLTSAEGEGSKDLAEGIRENTTVFFCIQTKSAPAWGLQTGIVDQTTKLHLDIIDHRSYHHRQSDNTVVNEIYAKDSVLVLSGLSEEEQEASLRERRREIKKQISGVIHQENAVIRVQRWIPQLSAEIEEENVEEHLVRATGDALRKSMANMEKDPSRRTMAPMPPIGEDSFRASLSRNGSQRGHRRFRSGGSGSHGHIFSCGGSTSSGRILVSGGGSTSRRLVSGASHRRMPSRDGSADQSMRSYRMLQVGHIDDVSAGRLEGLFRHDDTRSHVSHASQSLDGQERGQHEVRDFHGIPTGRRETPIRRDAHGIEFDDIDDLDG